MSDFDAEDVHDLVIGSGQGGVPLAHELARRGRRVVLCERDRLGGSCVNYGCTPSKTLIASAQAAGRARGAASLGVHARVRVDGAAVLRRVREVRDAWNASTLDGIEGSEIELVRAEASFAEDGTVRAGGRVFRAGRVVINVGMRPLLPKIDGLEGARPLTDRNVWELDELPRRLVVIGGGYVGCELGQAFARLGSEVVLLQRSDRLLADEEPELGGVLADALRRDGVDVRLESEAVRVRRSGGTVHVELGEGDELEADALLVAAGRVANTEALQAPAAGIALAEDGTVAIDDRFATTRPDVWAIGDAAGQPAFTHVSWEDHRRLLDIWDGGDRTRDDAVVGYAVFTDPQAARAGLSYRQARQEGRNPRRARVDVADTARGAEWGFDLGYFEVVADGEGRLLGATFVAAGAAELIHVLQFAIQTRAHVRDLDRLVAIHPTFGENLPGLARKLRT